MEEKTGKGNQKNVLDEMDAMNEIESVLPQEAEPAEEPQFWVDVVRFYRKLHELNLSVNKLAKMVEMAASTLYKKLEMESQFKLSEIRKLCAAMQLTPEESYWIFFAGYVGWAA